VTRAISQYWLGKNAILDKYSLDGEHEYTVESVVGAAFLITPKARRQVGMLDEKYFMYFEDLDYCRRVQEKGLLTYYVPYITVVHVHGASGTGEVNKMLVESSKKYFGTFWYYLYTFILWSGQKLHHI
jgi:GT2 family glycosyltransferase